MSFILDALKKSETDRQRQASPALFEVKVAAPRRKFPMWAAALAVLLGVNVLALAWVLLRESDAPAVRRPRPTAPPPASSSARCRRTGNRAWSPCQIHRGLRVQRDRRAERARGAACVDAGAALAPLAEEPLLEGQQPAVPPDYDARDYRPAITPEQAGAIAAARRSGSLPSRDEVLAQGNQLPELRLDLHVYDANPADALRIHQHAQAARGRIAARGRARRPDHARPAPNFPTTASASRSTATRTGAAPFARNWV